MPEETEEEQETEQGEDTGRDPALIVRVDDADVHINLVSLVCPSNCRVDHTYSDTVLPLGREQLKRSSEKTCRSRAGYGGDDREFAH